MWLMGFNHLINKYLNYLFMIYETSVCNFFKPICKLNVVKFVVPILIFYKDDSVSIYSV